MNKSKKDKLIKNKIENYDIKFYLNKFHYNINEN